MYVIIETTNADRGCDAIYTVMGPYRTEGEALAVCAELRAVLPSGCDSHESYPIDYTVRRVQTFVGVVGDTVQVAA